MFCSDHTGFFEKLKLHVTLKNWNISHKSTFLVSLERPEDLATLDPHSYTTTVQWSWEFVAPYKKLSNSPQSLLSPKCSFIIWAPVYNFCLWSILIVSFLHTAAHSHLCLLGTPHQYSTHTHTYTLLVHQIFSQFPNYDTQFHTNSSLYPECSSRTLCLLHCTYSPFKCRQVYPSLAFPTLLHHHQEVEWIASSFWNSLLHVCDYM